MIDDKFINNYNYNYLYQYGITYVWTCELYVHENRINAHDF